MKGECIVCGIEIDVEICCSGKDCGCMGMPTEPPVCSDMCYEELADNYEKYYPNDNGGGADNEISIL